MTGASLATPRPEARHKRASPGLQVRNLVLRTVLLLWSPASSSLAQPPSATARSARVFLEASSRSARLLGAVLVVPTRPRAARRSPRSPPAPRRLNPGERDSDQAPAQRRIRHTGQCVSNRERGLTDRVFGTQRAVAPARMAGGTSLSRPLRRCGGRRRAGFARHSAQASAV